MAVSIVVNSNSYISLADAKTYVTTSFSKHTAWDAATDDNKSLALIQATKRIDRGIYRGVKTISSQTLQFPRAIRTDYNRNDVPSLNITLDNNWVVESSTSQRVLDACCEEAIALLENASDANSDTREQLQAQGVKSFSLGNLSETYNVTNQTSTKILSKEARELLSYYTVGGIMIR